MGKTAFNFLSPKVEEYLSGVERAQTARQIAEHLEMTHASAYNLLALMQAKKKVLKVKRGGKHYYLPMGIYSDEQISALLPPKKVKPTPRRRRSKLHKPRPQRSTGRESLLEKHLATMRTLASSFEFPSALAVIGLNQIDAVEEGVVPATEVVLSFSDIAVLEKESMFETPRKIERFATVEDLPKDARRLTLRQMEYLKEKLKGLPGCESIDMYETAFAEFFSLMQGSYGTIFYFSMSTQPWERIYSVTVEDAIPLEMIEPVKMVRGKRRSIYDPILDKFLELGHTLVEIDVEGRKPNSVAFQLRKRISNRGLEFSASTSGGFVYLERNKRD